MYELLTLNIFNVLGKSTFLKRSILLGVFCVFCFQKFSFAQRESIITKLDKIFSGKSYIEQDQFGYMWFTDSRGIYKYDGYNYTLLEYRDIFGADFSTNVQCTIKKDNNQNIWLYTNNGELTKLGKEGNYVSYKKNISSGTLNRITSINTGPNHVWFGSEKGVVYKYDDTTHKLDSIIVIPNIKGVSQSILSLAKINRDKLFISTISGDIFSYSLHDNSIKKVEGLVERKAQNVYFEVGLDRKLWIATELEGLICYDLDKEIILKQYGLVEASNNNNTPKYDLFISIYCDKYGVIWSGTDGAGLYKIKDDKLSIYKHDDYNQFTISNNTITTISEDLQNNIWISTKKGQINKLQNNESHIQFYSGLKKNAPLNVNPLCVLKSSDGSLWIGTDGKGINRVLPDNTTIQYNETNPFPFNFEGKYIIKMEEDSKGNIWIATYLNGLWVYNVNKKQFYKIKTTDDLGREISDIRFIFKDSKNRIWVSLMHAFYVFSENQVLLSKLDYENHGLFGGISENISEDEHGTIWVGVLGGGLFNFNENIDNFNNSYFSRHNYYVKEEGSSLNYNIKFMSPDYRGNLWLTCTSGMLIKYELETNRFKSFNKERNFEDIRFRSVLIENAENLWLSSSTGIHHYNTNTETIKSYYQTDGFMSNKFVTKNAYKDHLGQLYFGNEYGVNVFDPIRMDKKESHPKLYINQIEILNKPARNIIPDQIKGYTENIKSLKLDHNQSSFSFHFSAIDKVLNTNYNYAYRLKGFQDDWIFPKNNRTASYTNIPYGNYIFEVKAGSKKGEWDIAIKTIDIKINPPWWYSIWAYILYLLLALFIIYSIVVWLRLKNRLAKEAWHNNKEKELYALKMNFFAKMSHEIQTPLTLILGPIGDMLSRAGANGNQLLKQRLTMINNNANRLSRIAMELMTVRNKELGKLRLFASKNDLIDHLKGISVSFSEQARFKNIDFIQKYPEDAINLWYDRDKIEHVIYNLLSNAFKFTPLEGTITLKVVLNSNDETVIISVLDSGPGIPKEELDDVFKLFYQTDLGKHNKGIGIGLALSKELISLHHGAINVDSSPEFGTCFSIRLTTREDAFSENEKIHIENSNLLSNTLEAEFNLSDKDFNLTSVDNIKKKHTLLIVEDNIEMQIFLQDVLSNNYNLLIANNGKEGIELADKNTPDLIISDIMMPVLDGLEMCKILQKKKATSHIPIILLTAKNTTTTKIKGLKQGAIEYISKPFNFHELILKIHNIINSNAKVLSKYKTDSISSSQEILAPTKDDIFMERLVEALNTQIENPDFKLEELSNSLNMSYSVIFRKCHDITGKTLIEFVRSLRFKRAALLIAQQGYNISEAAYNVGYKDTKYFTKCFKEEFGIPPATFKRQAKNIGVSEILKKYKI